MSIKYKLETSHRITLSSYKLLGNKKSKDIQKPGPSHPEWDIHQDSKHTLGSH